MTEMEFSYTDVYGKSKTLKTQIIRFDESTAGIEIEEPTLVSIDLRPAAGLKVDKSRFRFAIRHTQLKEIDLVPFAHATFGGGLDLDFSHNKLEFINLTRIVGPLSLRKVNLSHNELRTIEYKYAISSVTHFDLSHNQFVAFDFSPLSSKVDILNIDLSHNQLEFVDLTPLLNCRNLEVCNLDGNPKIRTIALRGRLLPPNKHIYHTAEILIEYTSSKKEKVAILTNRKTSESTEFGFMVGDYCDSCGKVQSAFSPLFRHESMWACLKCFTNILRYIIEN
ncbi:MAG: hypothetical protein RTU92_05505 [Candidatus Thorarchaeota archaeon]